MVFKVRPVGFSGKKLVTKLFESSKLEPLKSGMEILLLLCNINFLQLFLQYLFFAVSLKVLIQDFLFDFLPSLTGLFSLFVVFPHSFHTVHAHKRMKRARLFYALEPLFGSRTL